LDTFAGTFGVIKAPKFGELNPVNLSKLWTSPEVLQLWQSLGSPHFIGLLNHFLDSGQEGTAIDILNALGIKVSRSDEPFTNSVNNAIIQAYGPDGALRKLDANNQVSQCSFEKTSQTFCIILQKTKRAWIS
jgi:hypothetical protein